MSGRSRSSSMQARREALLDIRDTVCHMAESPTPPLDLRALSEVSTTTKRTDLRNEIFGTLAIAKIHELVERTGVTVEAGFAALSRHGITIDEYGSLLGSSSRTVSRRLAKIGTVLTSVEADRLYRFARVMDLAVEMIGDAKKADSWFRTPHRYLGGKTPLRMVETDAGTQIVEKSLYAIAYGGVA